MNIHDNYIGKPCIVRTQSAGVHFGTVESIDGSQVALSNARRIWSWKGANTLNEIALRGVAVGSRISEPVESILLIQAIEVIPLCDLALSVLEDMKWAK